MDKVGIVLLAIVGMLAWIGLWVWVGLFGLSIGGRAIDPVSAYVHRRWLLGRQWLKKPKNAATALQWVVRTAALAAILFALNLDADNPTVGWLDDYRGEIAGIAFTVLVIEEVGRLRSSLEFKDSVIRQLASRSNDFALDAARIAEGEGWLKDGSLQGAVLLEANLQGAFLEGANLYHANLLGANLQGANLAGANLHDVFLWAANLHGADLWAANLHDASLRKANLHGADLWVADLHGADLREANFQDADLREANLQDADLWEANLHGADLSEAEYNSKTIWPDGFDPIAAGAILVER